MIFSRMLARPHSEDKVSSHQAVDRSMQYRGISGRMAAQGEGSTWKDVRRPWTKETGRSSEKKEFFRDQQLITLDRLFSSESFRPTMAPARKRREIGPVGSGHSESTQWVASSGQNSLRVKTC